MLNEIMENVATLQRQPMQDADTSEQSVRTELVRFLISVERHFHHTSIQICYFLWRRIFLVIMKSTDLSYFFKALYILLCDILFVALSLFLLQNFCLIAVIVFVLGCESRCYILLHSQYSRSSFQFPVSLSIVAYIYFSP
jgi:hypothetical protein